MPETQTSGKVGMNVPTLEKRMLYLDSSAKLEKLVNKNVYYYTALSYA